MTRLTSRNGLCVVLGVLLCMGFLLSFGAAQQQAPPSPQFSVQYTGHLMMITDHEANRLFIYKNGPEASELQGSIDLTLTGADRLLAEPPLNENR